MEPLQFDEIVEETCDTYQHMAAQKSIRLDVQTIALRVFGNPSLLSEAIGNLVANAIKYSAFGVASCHLYSIDFFAWIKQERLIASAVRRIDGVISVVQATIAKSCPVKLLVVPALVPLELSTESISSTVKS